jgi:hypothetical protein
MDKDKFEQFVEYYRRLPDGVSTDVIDYIYNLLGCEFIFDLPVEYKTDSINDIKYTVIQGTSWMHSTTGPVYVYKNKPEFFILGYYVTLDEWLPRSALSPEDITLFKLKYG